VLDNKILNFSVIYEGQSLYKTATFSRRVSLPKAIRIHSLQSGFQPPIFGLAKDRDGQTHGICDTANAIEYEVVAGTATSPASFVNRVTYLSRDAPVLRTSRIRTNESSTLIRAAERESIEEDESSTVIAKISSPEPTGRTVITGSIGAEPSSSEHKHDSKPGPFGLNYGLTRSDIIKLVGEHAIEASKESTLTLTTVPNPYPEFEKYIAMISPEKGLLKIVAIGRNIDTNSFGEELHDKLIEIRDAVAKTYGEPKTLDFVRSGSIWNEPRDWMMGLLKKERTLTAYWDLRSSTPNHITLVDLQAKALSMDKGYLTLSYEFEGWEAFVDSQKSKTDSVF